jgi:hypothetical protein
MDTRLSMVCRRRRGLSIGPSAPPRLPARLPAKLDSRAATAALSLPPPLPPGCVAVRCSASGDPGSGAEPEGGSSGGSGGPRPSAPSWLARLVGMRGHEPDAVTGAPPPPPPLLPPPPPPPPLLPQPAAAAPAAAAAASAPRRPPAGPVKLCTPPRVCSRCGSADGGRMGACSCDSTRRRRSVRAFSSRYLPGAGGGATGVGARCGGAHTTILAAPAAGRGRAEAPPQAHHQPPALTCAGTSRSRGASTPRQRAPAAGRAQSPAPRRRGLRRTGAGVGARRGRGRRRQRRAA